MDARNDDVFIVGSVENADHAAGRDSLLDAPEEIVLELGLGRDLEAGHVAAHWIDAAKDFPDGAVLTGSVATLEHDEERVAGVGVEFGLEFLDAFAFLLCGVLEFFALGEGFGPRRILVVEFDLARVCDWVEGREVFWHSGLNQGKAA